MKSRLGRVLRTASTLSQEILGDNKEPPDRSVLWDDRPVVVRWQRAPTKPISGRCIALRNEVRSEQGGACELKDRGRRFASINEVEGGGWKTASFGSGETLTSLSQGMWSIEARQGNGLVHRPSDCLRCRGYCSECLSVRHVQVYLRE
jgi:hypothetical protein